MIASRMQRSLALAIVAAGLITAGSAAAQATHSDAPNGDPDVTVYRGAPQRLVVDHFEGPGSEMARAAVVQALDAEPSVEVVSVRFYRQAAGALDGSPASYAAVAKRLTLAAILRGKTSQNREGYTVTLSVVNGESGEIVSRLRLSGKRLAVVRTKIRAQLWPFLSPILWPSSAPSSQTPAPAPPSALPAQPGTPQPGTPQSQPGTTAAPPAEPQVPAQPEEPPAWQPPEVPMFPRQLTSDAQLPSARLPPTAARCPWLSLGGMTGVIRRLYGYHEEQRGALRAYVLDRSPIAGVEVTAFPFVARPCRGTQGFGVAGAYELMLGAHSEVGGRTLGTTGSALQLDVLYRFRFASVSITPRLGYRGRYFNVEGDVVPDVAYSSPRLALELGMQLGPAFAEFVGAGSIVLDAGELDSANWFPNASGLSYAFDARLGVDVLDWVSVVLGGHLELYRLRLNVAQDSVAPNGVAESTTDRFLSASIGVRFQLSREARP